ncbi:kinase domain-containing protein [Aspergillus uvarum CBS 121591]|uniref:Kinase domain-containing protein n=1 Tax=Aspergillus uvarum CBS 121591 TaxID=1448315 RepID=A0A319C353_9EURO|nr:kinase domain-containing protein [Aspergillus uvarum CBS 121591]PYH79545.1 kinase domain-containing protein [Aspergillus uvarum CBS 121591]
MPPSTVGGSLADGRYQVVDKLGYGGYATIWLARDLRTGRYVAVKTMTADASNDTPDATLLHSLGPLPPRPGKEVFPPLLDEFWAASPNGQHRCIATPPARMGLFDAKEASTFGLFRPRVAQAMIAQLIRGVSFLHSLGFVHGDLHLGNILVQFPRSLDCIAPSELYERYGEPESEEVVRLDDKPLSDSVPARVFIPGWFGVCSDDLPLGEEQITLSDFGESFKPRETARTASKTLPLLPPPEARFSDEPLSFASDIWTLACTIWEILAQRPLFETFFSSPDRVTAEQWWAKWSRRLDWFDEEGRLDLVKTGRAGPGGGCRSWERRFEDSIQTPRAEVGFERVTEEERAAFLGMLRGMLAFRAGERSTAREVLESRWMGGWGIPASEESWGGFGHEGGKEMRQITHCAYSHSGEPPLRPRASHATP